ncbi:MAG: hypothetical protein HQK83_01990 [Fibrobacteria bacterium]|nr:hypothetical protein [Fibrobacteria bacterium]
MSTNDKMEIPGLYKLIPLTSFRETEGVSFDILSPKNFPAIHSIDRVIHKSRAVSPGRVGDVEKAWYLHQSQDDNLMVMHGVRYVDLYNKEYGKVLSFKVTADEIILDGEKINTAPAMLTWPRGVFHRVMSGDEGSISINLATHYDNFDIKTNFSIYDLNVETGEYKVIRKGELDQHNV